MICPWVAGYAQNRRFDMRHDGHQVYRLVARRLVDLKRIRQSAVIIAGIRDARMIVMATFSTPATRSKQSTARIKPVVLQLVSLDTTRLLLVHSSRSRGRTRRLCHSFLRLGRSLFPMLPVETLFFSPTPALVASG